MSSLCLPQTQRPASTAADVQLGDHLGWTVSEQGLKASTRTAATCLARPLTRTEHSASLSFCYCILASS